MGMFIDNIPCGQWRFLIINFLSVPSKLEDSILPLPSLIVGSVQYSRLLKLSKAIFWIFTLSWSSPAVNSIIVLTALLSYIKNVSNDSYNLGLWLIKIISHRISTDSLNVSIFAFNEKYISSFHINDTRLSNNTSMDYFVVFWSNFPVQCSRIFKFKPFLLFGWVL